MTLDHPVVPALQMVAMEEHLKSVKMVQPTQKKYLIWKQIFHPSKFLCNILIAVIFFVTQCTAHTV